MARREKTVIIAEKPSVARDLARVVGASQQGQGYFHGGGYTVTWAIGHLVTLPEPHKINPTWKSWSFNHLPMLPEKWPLVAVEKTKPQFEIVKQLVLDCDEVICATDAGREGELIFRYIYELAKCNKPVRRLWISSLTTDSIKLGLANLKASEAYDSLADAARARSRADWLYGMNLSRAYALSTNEQMFIGRVQTPTLAMVVERDLKILNFVPEDYLVIRGSFEVEASGFLGSYLGEAADVAKPLSAKEKHFSVDGELAQCALQRMTGASAKIAIVDGKTIRQPAPLLYDLTELQRHCNRLFGFSAAATLGVAQSLYERHKLISYPRTGSRHLSQSVAESLPEIVEKIRDPYESLICEATGTAKLNSRFVDDAKVTDHHAILPTGTRAALVSLSSDEQKVYDLICRRLLMAWQSEYVTSVTTVITQVGEQDLFKSQGTMVVDLGWKALDHRRAHAKSQDPNFPSGLADGLAAEVLKIEALQKRTEPPPHLTESTLLTGMESAGRNLEDRELAEWMQDSGLGTPATRAGIIETLLARQYIERKEKSLISTALGQKLIATVHPTVKSPELTARWEKLLGDIQDRKSTLKEFMKKLEAEVVERVSEISQNPLPARSADSAAALKHKTSRDLTDSQNLSGLLKKYFGFDSFRASQEFVCRSVTEGKDVLLVMPTGAGKSLCYQIPGIARGGTTLVVSPLVALIEDQVAKLKSLGFEAERIHSGRNRDDSRLVCQKYLAGELDFLFIAPERLSVPGFPEFLRRRLPTLIAIDEAHCISQWGHDFRPDYRILGERLKELRPAPVIALTATATPTVQDDICKQLGIESGERVIQGFRRTNISIEVAELAPSERPGTILEILKGPGRLPAIVYAPTRKKTDELTDELSSLFRVGSYHAGMSTQAREKIQSQFINGKLDVMVATVAFGMGIDKANIRTVIHAAMPGSIEGYYQEIGRAGRDGEPSRAYLLHSFADQKTHEFFFDMNYPDIARLKSIFAKLSNKSIQKEEVRFAISGMDLETFERSLEQLWVHRGVIIDPEENMTRGQATWEKSYQLQRDLKQKQLKQMWSFATSGKCRMVYLVSHFGDQADSMEPCGCCDVCQPLDASAFKKRRGLSEAEKQMALGLLSVLRRESGVASGKLFQLLQDSGSDLSRSEFEKIAALLEQQGWISSTEASFEKEGQSITYRKLSLKNSGQNRSSQDLDQLEITGPASIVKAAKRPRTLLRKKAKTSAKAKRAKVSGAPGLFEPLREWRLVQAKRKKVPAFRILTDKALYAICEERPNSIAELLEVSSIPRKAILQYGEEILQVIRNF